MKLKPAPELHNVTRVYGEGEPALRVFDAIDQQSNHINGRLGEVVVQLQSTGSTINDLLVTTSGTISSHLKETSDIVARQMQD